MTHCTLSNRRQTDSLANSILSHPNNERPTTSILDSPISKPLQQKKQKVNHEHEIKPTPSGHHNIVGLEEESGPIGHPCPDKSEHEQNTNLQHNQSKESTAYLSNITTAGLRCLCSAPLAGQRKLFPYMIEIAQKAAAKKRLKIGHASYIIPRSQRRYDTRAINTKRKNAIMRNTPQPAQPRSL
jgi:hypothetical protein